VREKKSSHAQFAGFPCVKGLFRLDTALLEASENRCMVPARVKQIICLKQRGQSSTVDCSHAKKPLALLVVLRAGQLSEEEKGLQQKQVCFAGTIWLGGGQSSAQIPERGAPDRAIQVFVGLRTVIVIGHGFR